LQRIAGKLSDLGLDPLTLETIPPLEKQPSGVTRQYVAEAYGETLIKLATQRDNLVVIDADLAIDCRVRAFELAYPERFIENGIAEQDMVSTACGLASQGLLPVVNSFANFLASRANEQIYNAESEGRKIIYALHYAGLIPAGPGKSHQSLRDISLLGALPDIEIIQPANYEETVWATEYAIMRAPHSCALRLVIGPSPRLIEFPESYVFTPGMGAILQEGSDAVMFAYGPVMLNEALTASELLAEQGIGLRVINMPWLNRVDTAWLSHMIDRYENIYVLEDHSPVGGLGDFLLNHLVDNTLIQDRIFKKLAVEGWPACGTPIEALRHHGLDGASLAATISGELSQ
nr:1-deoxy-D-xylulose-5-phosphate synthase [Anaerolineae bacterium]